MQHVVVHAYSHVLLNDVEAMLKGEKESFITNDSICAPRPNCAVHRSSILFLVLTAIA